MFAGLRRLSLTVFGATLGVALALPAGAKDPDAIAASYWHVVQQPRSAWTWEVELRPWVERF